MCEIFIILILFSFVMAYETGSFKTKNILITHENNDCVLTFYNEDLTDIDKLIIINYVKNICDNIKCVKSF